ncbi:hypothetical protein C8Q76DRAFT_796336 [Earliella scabrosa]|nr:hypothetical protein C8Q76DRAFT_796336 [Earliella scabrosa]
MPPRNPNTSAPAPFTGDGDDGGQGLAAQNARLAAAQLNTSGIDVIASFLMAQPFLQIHSQRQAYAMAFAYFSAGSHDDGRHHVGGARHPEYRIARSGATEEQSTALRQDYMRYLCDSLTTYDRLSGGVTVMLQTPGTRRPHTARIIEEIILNVYAPPDFLHEFPHVRIDLARLGQDFARAFGLPAMERWDRLSNKSSWAAQGIRTDTRPPPSSILPRSQTSYFRLYGYDPSAFENLVVEQGGLRRVFVPTGSIVVPGPMPTDATASEQPSGLPSSPVRPPGLPATPVKNAATPIAGLPVNPVLSSGTPSVAPSWPPRLPVPPPLTGTPSRPQALSTTTPAVFAPVASGVSSGEPAAVLSPRAAEKARSEVTASSSRAAEKSRAQSDDDEPSEYEWGLSCETNPFRELALYDQTVKLQTEIKDLTLHYEARIKALESERASLLAEVARLQVDWVTVVPSPEAQGSAPTGPVDAVPPNTPVRTLQSVSLESRPSTSLSSVSSISQTNTDSRVVSRAAVVSPAISAVASSSTSRIHRTIEPFGPCTRALFEENSIPKAMHAVLWDIESNKYDDEVLPALANAFNTDDDEFLAKMYNAMRIDSAIKYD